MILLKKRNCPECRREMRPQLINILYKKPQSDIQIEVIGIPANVCTQCYDRIIRGKVAKYIDSLVDPIFESEMHQTEKVLPAPHIDIQFPPVERAAYDYAHITSWVECNETQQ
jgi:hypothetical protein